MANRQTEQKVTITRVRYILSTRDLNVYVDMYEGRETAKKLLNLKPITNDPFSEKKTISPISKEVLGKPVSLVNSENWLCIAYSFRGSSELDLVSAHQKCLNMLMEEVNQRMHRVNALKSQIESFAQKQNAKHQQ